MENKKLTNDERKQIFSSKLESIREDLGDEDTAFVGTFCLDFDQKLNLKDKPKNEINYEEEYLRLAVGGVVNAKKLLIKNNIPYERPPDMFAEMVRSDEELERIREKLEEQRQNKEKILSRKKQAQELRDTPKADDHNKQKKPGLAMKPKKSPKQIKRDKQRQRQQRAH